MRLICQLVLCMLLVLCPGFPGAQTFQQLPDIEGQSLEDAMAVEQDSMGFIWIACSDGLFRYDGHQLVPLQQLTTDTLIWPVTSINAIYRDADNHLWFGGEDGVLFEYDPVAQSARQVIFPRQPGLSDYTIFDLAVDDQSIYLASEQGFAILDRATEKSEFFYPGDYVTIPGLNFLNTLYGLMEDRFDPDRIWLFSRGGLYSFRKSDRQILYHTKPIKDYQTRGLQALVSGYQDDEGKIWVAGGYLGARSYDPSADKWEYYLKGYFPEKDAPNYLRKILPRDENSMWVLSVEEGLGIFSPHSGTYTYYHHDLASPYASLDPPYQSMFMDKKGSIWICGIDGVSFFNPAFQKVFKIPFPKRETERSVQEICAVAFQQLSPSEVLVGTVFGDGLYLANIDNGTVELVDEIAGGDYLSKRNAIDRENNIDDLNIYALFSTSAGEIWVNTNDGILLYDKVTHRLVQEDFPFNASIRNRRLDSFVEDAKGRVWTVSPIYNQIYCLDPQNKTLIRSYDYREIFPQTKNLRGDPMTGLALDSRQRLWVCSYYGLAALDPETGEVTSYKPQTEREREFIATVGYDLVITRDNKLILTSISQGVLIIDLNGRQPSKIINLSDGLKTNRVYKITEDHSGLIWLATNKGLVRITRDGIVKDVLTEEDGLVEANQRRNYFASIHASKYGNVFCYSPDYFSWVDLNKLDAEAQISTTLIAGLEVTGKPYISGENLNVSPEVKLSYRENYFTLHFGLNDFTLPGRQTYTYRLEGYDNDWSETNRPYVSYTKVPPGNFTFMVRGRDYRGNETLVTREMKIRIIPPFWRTTGFYLGMGGIVFAGIFAAYRYRTNQIRDKERLKTEFNQKIAQIEMDALRAQMNPHFLFNCLNSIRNYALTKGPYETADYLTKFAHLIRLILQNSKNSTVSLYDELDALKLYIEIEALRFENKFEYNIHVDEGIEMQSVHIPPMILQPYVENAIWHGLMHKEEGGGKLIIEIKNMGETIQCIIEDNGIGREKAAEIKRRKEEFRKKSLGMQITSDRIALTNQLYRTNTHLRVIDLRSATGEAQGTRVVVDIPILEEKGKMM